MTGLVNRLQPHFSTMKVVLATLWLAAPATAQPSPGNPQSTPTQVNLPRDWQMPPAPPETEGETLSSSRWENERSLFVEPGERLHQIPPLSPDIANHEREISDTPHPFTPSPLSQSRTSHHWKKSVSGSILLPDLTASGQDANTTNLQEWDASPQSPLLNSEETPANILAQIPDARPNGTPSIPPPPLPPPQDVVPPSPPPSPEPPKPQPLPPPAELLDPFSPSPGTPEAPDSLIQETITVERFEFVGNTAFSDEQLGRITAEFTNRPITFAELLNARTIVTQLYTENGYVTSGAFIPPQTLTEGTITIEIVEGGLEEIQIRGTQRLNPGYVRSRLALATPTPLNVPRLLEALRLLQLDPLIENVSAELSTGSGPGTSLLIVDVAEANTWSYQLFANNGRSPSVGSFRRGASVTQANLLGWGDGLTVGYTNTDGSNEIDLSYTLPINPRNGTLNVRYGNTSSEIIEQPFNFLDIQSASSSLDLTFRQPLIQTPTQEFALGLTAARRSTKTVFLENLIGEERGFPSPGADEEGRTRVSALRFFQEWTQRSAQDVIALRSQFNLGVDVFNATVNEDAPDSRFFSWRGQAQWVKLLAPETLLLVRGDIQLADQNLLPIEQFGLGGLGSVRGYRQDIRLTDNGAFASVEVRFPILRVPQWQGVLQVTPFVDWGTTWNSGDTQNPSPSSLAAIGLGLQWQQSDRLTARLDWGIPLISVDSANRTWQENGLYFSIMINPF